MLVEPGLPCDCAVNTAVLSQREPAQHRETLSSLLLLIEKPIAIYLLTLDIESIPRGAAPAEPLLGSPSHLPSFGLRAVGGMMLILLQVYQPTGLVLLGPSLGREELPWGHGKPLL